MVLSVQKSVVSVPGGKKQYQMIKKGSVQFQVVHQQNLIYNNLRV